MGKTANDIKIIIEEKAAELHTKQSSFQSCRDWQLIMLAIDRSCDSPDVPQHWKYS